MGIVGSERKIGAGYMLASLFKLVFNSLSTFMFNFVVALFCFSFLYSWSSLFGLYFCMTRFYLFLLMEVFYFLKKLC